MGQSKVDNSFWNGRRLLRTAGAITLLIVAVPAAFFLSGYEFMDIRFSLPPWSIAVWSLSAVVYAVAFWLSAAGIGQESLKTRARWLVGLQAVAALTMFQMICTGLESTQLVVVAAQLGLFFPLSIGIPWVILQSAIQGFIAYHHWPSPELGIWWAGSLTLPYSILALLTSYMTARQTRARQELARSNAELRATEALLTDSSRMAERARISNELHDLLGHHLTALSLNLEAASHLTEGRGREAVEKSRSLAKLLLSDVREAVSTARETPSVDLIRALSPLVEGIPRPEVHLELSDHLELTDPERAHALVRCVQEIITNAARHSAAQNLWIEIRESDQGLVVQARDDGKGAEEIRPGQGLAGMRERLERLGGRLEVASKPDEGFRVQAWLPIEEAAG